MNIYNYNDLKFVYMTKLSGYLRHDDYLHFSTPCWGMIVWKCVFRLQPIIYVLLTTFFNLEPAKTRKPLENICKTKRNNVFYDFYEVSGEVSGFVFSKCTNLEIPNFWWQF